MSNRIRPAAQLSPQVVVTREKGKNGKLMKALKQRGISVLELPLVETAEGPDRQLLPAVLQEGGFDWVIVTSPESASVFLEGWRSAGKPAVSPASSPVPLCLMHQGLRSRFPGPAAGNDDACDKRTGMYIILQLDMSSTCSAC